MVYFLYIIKITGMMVYTVRRYASAVYDVSLSVFPSSCLLQASIGQKLLNVMTR